MKSIAQEISIAAFTAAVRKYLNDSLNEHPAYFRVRVNMRQVAWPYIEILFLDRHSRAQHDIMGPLHNTPAELTERMLSLARDVALNCAPSEVQSADDQFSLVIKVQDFGSFWKIWGSVEASSRIAKEHTVRRPVSCRIRLSLAA